ncbi:hypothetical protein EVA_03977 [gut metagenome]|uniref:Uncharacterized protein n=1 Tax=gut metagenome TaxID=749906 RepID=J9D5B6_9ZZZZ
MFFYNLSRNGKISGSAQRNIHAGRALGSPLFESYDKEPENME